MKCAGNHLTKDCKKKDLKTPKCINCQGNHPANYRGCELAKHKQREKNEILRRKRLSKIEQQQITQQQKNNYIETKDESRPQQYKLTYAQA